MILLSEPSLGVLALRSTPYTVASYEIGAPAVREVMRDRALADGAYDDTAYVGARAATVAVTLNEQGCPAEDVQSLIDTLAPYMEPRRRPWLSWVLPGSEQRRMMQVRGNGLPISVSRRRHLALVCQFVSGDGLILSGDGTTVAEECQVVARSSLVEAGRTYDLTFNRQYPPSDVIGFASINVGGSMRAHTKITIFGPVTDPFVWVNSTQVTFTGITIPAGQWITIDTKERTIRLNDDPLAPRAQYSNFAAWQWSDLMLNPGDNLVRFNGSALGPTSSARFCWVKTWAA